MPILDLFTRKRLCHLLVNRTGEIAAKYNHFMDFLSENRTTLALISELEHLYYQGGPFTMATVAASYRELRAATRALTAALNALSHGKYKELDRAIDRINQKVAPILAPRCPLPTGALVLPLEALEPEMVRMAGAKATNLGLIRKFVGAPVPPGFVITARATHLFFQETGLAGPIAERLGRLSPEAPPELLDEASRGIRDLILAAEVPARLAAEILQAYRELEAKTRAGVRLAMRSSAVGEDSEASFAGQYATELNVTGDQLLSAYQQVLASKYSPRAIAYRRRYGLEDWDTLMCVAGIVMLEARASGVLYTVDPARPDANRLKISAIWGLGEYLVSGAAQPDAFFLDKKAGVITRRLIRRKTHRLVNLPEGGTRLEEVPLGEQELPCLDDAAVLALARYGSQLEDYFHGPQDVEWALDHQGQLFLLQSRPLGLVQAKIEQEALPKLFSGHPVLLSGGQVVSPGIATGQVFLTEGAPGRDLPAEAILVCRTASPDHARLLGKVKGIVTEIGSVTSHLASVARETGIPALFNVGEAAAILKEGDPITLVSGWGDEQGIIYKGLIEQLADVARPRRRPLIESPLHRRLRDLLDKVAPLNLTDPRAPGFSPRGCRTFHDIIRYAHEMLMQEMFGLAAGADGATSVRLTTDIPLTLHLIDLGGGLRAGLTTCDTITADHLESLPMRALWRGFCHPGITWQGGVSIDASNLLTLMARGAVGELPGGESYAILSREYLNLSAKFGYHFANLDAYLSDDPAQNRVFLRFAGGAGTYYGKSLRLNYLGNVLSRLGFKISVTGDLLDASLSGYDPEALGQILDQVGRLLATSRLLDLAITNEASVQRMIEAFFRGDYDFLQQAEAARIPGFYTNTGNWKLVEVEGRKLLQQDGSEYGSILTAGLANFMGKVMGHKYLELLDNIEAYFYFPLAIARDSEMAEGTLRVRVKPVAGSIDQAGGLAFGIQNINNYFVLRINALEDNVILFEYVNGRRLTRATVPQEIRKEQWRLLAVEFSGRTLKGYLDGELLVEYAAGRALRGYVGLWTKADSVTFFDELTIEAQGQKRVIEFQDSGRPEK